jgi:hypothetical protein
MNRMTNLDAGSPAAGVRGREVSVSNARPVRLFRLHIRPKGGLADPARAFAYCLREEVLGVGWQVQPPSGAGLAWKEYESLATQEHGKGLSRVRFLHDHVRPDHLIWTRDTRGKYYLARVCTPWEYFDTADGRDADIVNVVRCHILEVPHVDDVPGKVVACFRPTRAIQPIVDPTAVIYSQILWNQLATEDHKYALPSVHRHNIFTYLDAETTEDVIFIYLQLQGWIVFPHSRKVDTMAHEFVAIRRLPPERALVQVKTGNTPLDTASWGAFRERVFLFQANGIYHGTPTRNVAILSPATIEDFIRKNVEIMPGAVQRWVKFVEP